MRGRSVHVCRECGRATARWAGRCPGCGAWGSLDEAPAGARGSVPAQTLTLGSDDLDEPRVSSGLEGLDRALGGGIVPASVVLLGGEPGIGKSTLLLHVLSNLSRDGHACLLVSGEETHGQVAARARRLGLAADAVAFAPGRDLQEVVATARAAQPFLLAVDSIQTVRAPEVGGVPGGPSQVRAAADALVGLAKAERIAVLLTGHVTKDGELAGPRTLEHAVDVVLSFDGDPRSGLRVLTGGKNRFGPEGEAAWFEMGPSGLAEIDPTGLLAPGAREAGAATALVLAGRRAIAVEVQALVGASEGPPRRQAAGLDPRRLHLVAAVVERALGLGLGRSELFGASSGGARVDDPAADLAVAVAIASAATGVPPPAGAAFAGEVALTGVVRQAPAMSQRLAAARAAGCTRVFAPSGTGEAGLEVHRVGHVREAIVAALGGEGARSMHVENPGRRRTA